MMEAGVHFGHGTNKWNPRMAPYISAKRKVLAIFWTLFLSSGMVLDVQYLFGWCAFLMDISMRLRLEKKDRSKDLCIGRRGDARMYLDNSCSYQKKHGLQFVL
ncbi:hypothetical protein M5K25_010695 [Dendrobium thyrsiflorum]|uniref:30S ribosomal protein S2, chloroplastic n=1 Tax=Dendrobium thyrsiflorum TaxID=117978 RepID=A0ABD0V7J7_DENTH